VYILVDKGNEIGLRVVEPPEGQIRPSTGLGRCRRVHLVADSLALREHHLAISRDAEQAEPTFLADGFHGGAHCEEAQVWRKSDILDSSDHEVDASLVQVAQLIFDLLRSRQIPQAT
jgi:hypothetical protein